MPSSPDVLGEESNVAVTEEIDWQVRRHEQDTAEDDGPIDVAPERLGVTLSQKVCRDRQNGADKPEPVELGIQLSGTECSLRTDRSPNDGRSTESLCTGASPDGRGRVADTVNVVKDPGLHEDLNDSGDSGGGTLAPEHEPRGNLHVVTDLHVVDERHALRHGDVSVRLEDHHGNGLAGNSETDDQFRDDVETDLLVRDGLDHADGQGQNDGDGQGKEKSPNRHSRGPGSDSRNTHGEVDEEDSSVPPKRNLQAYHEYSPRIPCAEHILRGTWTSTSCGYRPCRGQIFEPEPKSAFGNRGKCARGWPTRLRMIRRN